MIRSARLFSWISGLVVLFGAAEAFAQTGTIQVLTPVTRKLGSNRYPPNIDLNKINYNDCINDDVISIPLKLAGTFNSYNLEAWVGADCATNVNRSATGTCWQVYSQAPPSGFDAKLEIKVRD